MKVFVYDGKEYQFDREVRQALYEKERKAICEAPKADSEKFWAEYGISIVEKDEPIEELKQRKTSLIKQAFLTWRNNTATLKSSLGFVIDSDTRAFDDISGLSAASDPNDVIIFRDANNGFHSLSQADLKVLLKEVVANGSYAYEQKWNLQEAVLAAETVEDLEAIEVKFKGKDFSVTEG